MFAGGLSLTQSSAAATASLRSQVLETLKLEVQLLPQSFSVLNQATDCRNWAICRISIAGGTYEGITF